MSEPAARGDKSFLRRPFASKSRTLRKSEKAALREVAISGGGVKPPRRRKPVGYEGRPTKAKTRIRVRGLTPGEWAFYATFTHEEKQRVARRLLDSIVAQEDIPSMPIVRQNLRKFKSDSFAIYNLAEFEVEALRISQALAAYLAHVARKEATGEILRVLNEEAAEEGISRRGSRAA